MAKSKTYWQYETIEQTRVNLNVAPFQLTRYLRDKVLEIFRKSFC